MPGFVDVTGWSSEEVRRLGHADDYDDVDHQPRRVSNLDPSTRRVSRRIFDNRQKSVQPAASQSSRIVRVHFNIRNHQSPFRLNPRLRVCQAQRSGGALAEPRSGAEGGKPPVGG